MNLDSLKFDENGLIPAIVQDAESGRVLTLAYMNRESLEITLAEGYTCFWSRSRKKLWRKGETSGNVQRVVDITADCDADALVVRVHKAGPACLQKSANCRACFPSVPMPYRPGRLVMCSNTPLLRLISSPSCLSTKVFALIVPQNRAFV